MLLRLNRLCPLASHLPSRDPSTCRLCAWQTGHTRQHQCSHLYRMVFLLVLLARVLPSNCVWLQLVESNLRFGVGCCVDLLCLQGKVPLRWTGYRSGRSEGTYEVRLTESRYCRLDNVGGCGCGGRVNCRYQESCIFCCLKLHVCCIYSDLRHWIW